MHIVHIIIFVLLLIPFGIAIWNTIAFAEVHRSIPEDSNLRVSVLVPARNEERSLRDCIESLMHQHHSDVEVIVLNDNSDDGTAGILAELAIAYPQLKVLDGAPLPQGWVGKNWACHQLSNAATGDVFVFTDADTIHTPECIGACTGFARKHRLDLFCGIPMQRMESCSERIIIPMMHILYFAFLPNALITGSRDPRFSAGNGQLLYVTRGAYRITGGHYDAKAEVVEDNWFARQAKQKGLRVALAIASEIVECRMYRSASEIISGFSKNLFPGLGYSPTGLTIFVLLMLTLFVVPVIGLCYTLITGDHAVRELLPWAGQVFLGMTMRGLMAYRFGLQADQVLYQPLSALSAVFIALNSARLIWFRSGAMWKGRRV